MSAPVEPRGALNDVLPQSVERHAQETVFVSIVWNCSRCHGKWWKWWWRNV